MDKKTVTIEGEKKTVWEIEGKNYTLWDIIISYASYLGVTIFLTLLVIGLYRNGNYVFATLALPITIIFWMIPFKRRSMQSKIEGFLMKRMYK